LRGGREGEKRGKRRGKEKVEMRKRSCESGEKGEIVKL